MTVLSSGSILGDFKIENEIGRGGMGVVYRATQVSLGRPVALKVIAGALAHQEGFRERFVRESRLAASLDHPNVIPVYAAGEDEGVLFIAMRFVDGTDLRSVLSAEGALEPMRAAGVVAQVAAALDAAHELGLVHRDVKPANVLVAARGGGEHVYLTDFGLTKRSASDSGLTAAGEWVGTLDYVAPEQLRGNQVDGRADVYALGCVLYEALTGGVPFPREDDVGKLWAHISDPPPWALDAAPATPRVLAEVAQRAMEKDPDDRFEDAGEMGRQALAAVPGFGDTGARARMAAGRSPRARRRAEMAAPTPRGPFSLASRRSRARTAALATGATEVIPDAGRRPAASPRRRIALAAAALLVACAVVAVALALGGDDEQAADGASELAGAQGAIGEIVGAPIAVGDSPADVAVGAGSVWVANEGGESVTRIDPKTRRAGRPIRVGEDPRALAVGAGSVWVANFGDGTVSRIDARSGRASPAVRVGRGPTDIAVGRTSVWVSTQETRVVRLDARTGQVAGSVRVKADGPLDLSAGRLWVADRVEGTMRGVDVATVSVVDAPTSLGLGPAGIATTRELVWATLADEGVVRAVPLAPGAPGGRSVETGGRPGALALSADSVWVADSEREALIRIDRDSGEPAGEALSVGKDPAGLAVDGDTVWVTSAVEDTVTRVEAQ